MTPSLDDLCRLCAKKNEFFKDILDENNKNVLEVIRRFTKIEICENDNLPTRICLDCEEKMISFQLFILECYKAQNALNNLYLVNCNIKLEDENVTFGAPIVKSEVKDELTPEDIVGAINNEATDFDSGVFQADDDVAGDIEADDNVVDDDDLDNITIASLRTLKQRETKVKPPKVDNKKKHMTEEEIKQFNKNLQKAYLKIKDVVKMECNICEQQCQTWNSLCVHYYKNHKKKPVAYCMCGFAIKSKSVLYQHITNHKTTVKQMPYSVDALKEQPDHKVHDYVDFTCIHCEKNFTSWDKLKLHCHKFHGVKAEVRCVCGITLKSKSSMYKHIQDHKNPNELSCDQCSLITKSLTALERHKLKHIPKSERKFSCSACDKIFTSKDALKSHEKSHIPIETRKVIHCDLCDLKFTTRSAAASHKRVVHEKIKSYVCDQCGYACGTNGELRQHRAIHSDEKPFECNTCSKSFKTYSNLKTHMDTHEATSYVCYVCNRVLNSRRTLRKHLLVHEDKCRHVCSYCNKAFKRRQTLKVHMYTHTGDKPLSCKWCNERFSYASTLRSHRLRNHPDKMAAAQTHGNFSNYSHSNTQQNYLKNDISAAVATEDITKNEVDAMS